MGGKGKSKNSHGLAKLFGLFWKSHGRKMAHSAVDKHGDKVVAQTQHKLAQRGDKYGDRGAQFLDSYGDRGIEMARARLAQNQQYQPAPAPAAAGYYAPAPQRPTTRPPPSDLGGYYRNI